MRIIPLFLKKLDLFGVPIQLSMKNEHLQKSSFSGFSSLIVIVTFISLSTSGFFGLFMKSDIQYISSDFSNLNPSFIDLSPNNFNWAFEISGESSERRLFNVEVYQGLYFRDSNGSFIKNKKVRNHEKCTSDHFNPNLISSMKVITSNLSSLRCPRLNESYEINGKYTSQNFSFINIKVSKCINTSSVTCSSEEEIVNAYKNNGNKIYFNIYSLNNLLYLNDLEKPIKLFLEDRIISLIDIKFYKEKNHYMTLNTLFTDSSLYRENYEKELEVFTYENNWDEAILDNSENMNKNDTLYLSLYIRSNFLSKEHKRTVKKIDEYLGYSGGLWSLFILLFGFLARKYNERKLMAKISNSLYKFVPEKETDARISRPTKKFITIKSNKNIRMSRLKLDSFRDKIRNYLLSIKGVELIHNWKVLIPGCFFKNDSKKIINQQKIFFDKAQLNVHKDMDAIHLLSKIREIDKIKEILFDENIIKFFDFICKRTINEGNEKSKAVSRSSIRFVSLSPEGKSMQEINNYNELFKNYSYIKNVKKRKMGSFEIGEKMLKYLDLELINIYEAEFINQMNNTNKEIEGKKFENDLKLDSKHEGLDSRKKKKIFTQAFE